MSQIASIYQAFLSTKGASTDSRSDNKDRMFFALKGANFNGNKYVKDVLKTGAAYAVADDPMLQDTRNVFIVEDVLSTLQALARFHRRQLNIPILAITGTNGKTTTKELVAAVLSQKYQIAATAGNFNNHIGVPLTLLSMDKSVELGVVEMGANHIGEIDALCQIAEPNYGLITNVGKAHLEGFGSFEGVKTAKGELYHYLKKNNGLVFINNDNPHLTQMAQGVTNTIEYGISQGMVTGHLTSEHPFISVKWQIDQLTEINTPTQLIGAYNLENILSAICIGHQLGVDTTAIHQAIATYTPTNNRSQFIQSARNQIIMDAYNANPSSMQVALLNFANIDTTNKVLILGGMKELGSDSETEHQKLIKNIESLPVSKVLLVGDEFKNMLPQKSIFQHFSSTDQLIAALKSAPLENACILIKGSRSNKLESLLPYL
ncbi:UDP-N-acetylmuramoyl-tripeptide--D-alanyl-D-alanine ligase [Carboxylicivirga taeanensis]|uniref:UDP-N-acetylmuramoyl-tripeptide--D-alanyl-D- alanine ligase n=1 Tax=Carboxylicivirga taeanensis TaxID=1416875 RepID=UPI003F6DBF38